MDEEALRMKRRGNDDEEGRRPWDHDVLDEIGPEPWRKPAASWPPGIWDRWTSW